MKGILKIKPAKHIGKEAYPPIPKIIDGLLKIKNGYRHELNQIII